MHSYFPWIPWISEDAKTWKMSRVIAALCAGPDPRNDDRQTDDIDASRLMCEDLVYKEEEEEGKKKEEGRGKIVAHVQDLWEGCYEICTPYHRQ